MQAAPLADACQFGAHVGDAGVAHLVGGGADVQAELAAPGHHVDGTVGYFQHAHRRHQVRHRRAALFQVQRQFCGGGGGVAPPVHRRGTGMAGHADDLAQEARVAVDRGDDAQRQVHFVEYRALLDMHLDEALVLARIALQLGDVFDAQTGVLHRLAHADAVGILLIQPVHVEVAGERARAQEHRLVALALLFGEADHLDAEGQAPAGAVQLAHAGHRHEDAQPPVVLAAVAHGVVVAAGEQPPGIAVAAMVEADHVADGVDLHLVEAAVGAHPVRQPLRAGAVRLGQVGDGEFAAFGITRIAVLRQALGPVPHQVAELGHVAELVVEPDLGDAVDVAQALGHLVVGVVVQPALEGGNDLGLVQSRAARAAHRQDEGEAELGVVVGIELLDLGELGRRAIGQPGLALFVRALGGERLAHHRLARQLGVGADQCQLRCQIGATQHLHQRQLQCGQAGKGPPVPGGFGDPG